MPALHHAGRREGRQRSDGEEDHRDTGGSPEHLAVLYAVGEPAKQGVQKAAFRMLLFTLMTAVFAERRSVAEAREVDYSDGTED